MTLKDEILKIKSESETKGIKNSKKILQLFKRSQDEILNKLSRLYMKYYTDEGLNLSDYQRYSVLSAIENQLRESLELLNDGQVQITYDTLSDVYETAYYKTAYIIERGVETCSSRWCHRCPRPR